MMNMQTIVYHTESIIETQLIIVAVLFYILEDPTKLINKTFNIDDMMLEVLFIEHIVSYAAKIYSKRDIERHGRADVNGIIRAPRESLI
jgi:hypothetical protein